MRADRARRWWNGKELTEGLVPWTAGLRLGEGVFETLRTYEGVPFLLSEHLDRLLSGAHALHLRGVPSRTSLRGSVLAALRKMGRAPGREWVVRISLSAGEPRTDLLLDLEALPPSTGETARKGVVVGSSSQLHPGKFFVPPGASRAAKWLARGPLSLALREAREHGWEEAILSGEEGSFVEGTRSNLVVVLGDRLIAPGPRAGALQGVTRELVVRAAARHGWKVVDRQVTPRDLRNASEVLLTSSLLGIAPVRKWGRRTWTCAGPVGGSLQKAHQDALVRARRSARTPSRNP